MELKVDYEELKKWVRKFEDEYDIYYFIKDTVDFLYTHNKNFTQTQWIKIMDLKNVIDCMSIREK